MENPIKMDDLGVPLFFGKNLGAPQLQNLPIHGPGKLLLSQQWPVNKSPILRVKHGIHLRRIPKDNFWKPTSFEANPQEVMEAKKVEQLHDLLMEWRETCKQEIMSIILLSHDDPQSSSLSANTA